MMTSTAIYCFTALHGHGFVPGSGLDFHLFLGIDIYPGSPRKCDADANGSFMYRFGSSLSTVFFYVSVDWVFVWRLPGVLRLPSADHSLMAEDLLYMAHTEWRFA